MPPGGSDEIVGGKDRGWPVFGQSVPGSLQRVEAAVRVHDLHFHLIFPRWSRRAAGTGRSAKPLSEQQAVPEVPVADEQVMPHPLLCPPSPLVLRHLPEEIVNADSFGYAFLDDLCSKNIAGPTDIFRIEPLLHLVKGIPVDISELDRLELALLLQTGKPEPPVPMGDRCEQSIESLPAGLCRIVPSSPTSFQRRWCSLKSASR